ncbi:hypothetical protein [Roseomonas sp. USHLN139]|uniref:hypothetical protein n=1 Tax=Roseomonas sp. USHLN139 TaxID=3081298 RepID=UPI003B0135F1
MSRRPPVAHRLSAWLFRLPLDTMSMSPSGSGRRSSRATSHGVSSPVFISSSVVNGTGIVSGWMTTTILPASQVRKA